jgi:lipid-A-disaccharide synthase
MSEKRLFIVAGEVSGDTHAARLIRAMRTTMPDLRVEGLGGDNMREAGCEIRADLVSAAVMGFGQVVTNLRFFRRLLRENAERMRTHRPDALVLVDYPGFNLRLAAAAKALNIPVVYYISPQIWAWRPRRIHKIARLVDKMIVILPFEEEIYRKANVDVTYVGHPLLDSISETELDVEFLDGIDATDATSIIGLLPGSRKQEILTLLPVLIDAARTLLKQMPDARFLIPCSSRENLKIVETIIGDEDLPVKFFLGKIYEVAKAARCCIVASGTATLEVACFLTPSMVVYKIGHLTWLLGRRFLQVDHISLVNILAGKEVVPEILQYRMRPELLAETAAELCREGEKRRNMIEELEKVRESLGTPGASLRAAKVVCELLDNAGKSASPTAAPREKLVTTDG